MILMIGLVSFVTSLWLICLSVCGVVLVYILFNDKVGIVLCAQLIYSLLSSSCVHVYSLSMFTSN